MGRLTTALYVWTDPEETQEQTFEVSGHYAEGCPRSSWDPGYPAHFEDVGFRLIGIATIDANSNVSDSCLPIDQPLVARIEQEMANRYSNDRKVGEAVQEALFEALPEPEYTR